MILKNLLFSFLFVIILSSCIVQAPKYSPVENVLKLKTGMSQQEVSDLLKIPPYDLKSIDSTGYVLIYKYRVTDRNVFPLFMKPNNGFKARGKWVDLFITYSKEGKVSAINSCTECGETKPKETRIDFNALLTFITITIPAVLLFLKVK